MSESKPSKFFEPAGACRPIHFLAYETESETEFRMIIPNAPSQKPEKTTADTYETSHAPSATLLSEFWQFTKQNKSWWMIPILVCLGIVGAEYVVGAKRKETSQSRTTFAPGTPGVLANIPSCPCDCDKRSRRGSD